MNWLIYVFGSGWFFFIGMGLVCLAVVAALWRTTWLGRFSVLGVLIGIALVVISAAPLPVWLWCLFGIGCLFWGSSMLDAKWSGASRLAFLVIVVFIVGWELHWHLSPSIPRLAERSLLVVGDSVTAGTGVNDDTVKWPSQLEADHDVSIDDRSVPGAKCSTALKQLQSAPIRSANIFLEIGGNDMLGSTSNESFETDLEELLRYACSPERTIIMFELPLPPFRNQYGVIQRRLARRFDVHLIPKRRFVSILTHEQATIDSVHLTQKGHDMMADLVWNILGSRFDRIANK